MKTWILPASFALGIAAFSSVILACGAGDEDAANAGSEINLAPPAGAANATKVDCSKAPPGKVTNSCIGEGTEASPFQIWRCRGDGTGAVLVDRCVGQQICFDDEKGTSFCKGDPIDCSRATEAKKCFGSGSEKDPFEIWGCDGKSAKKLDTCAGQQICFDDEKGTAFCRGDAIDCSKVPAGTTRSQCLGDGSTLTPAQVWTCDGPTAKKADTCTTNQVCFDDEKGKAFCRGDK